MKSGLSVFTFTRLSSCYLESLLKCITRKEPVLLVGETGTGKTTLVQKLALLHGVKLTVINMSQQSDISDLLGGYKPVDVRKLACPLTEEFQDLFNQTFSQKTNTRFIQEVRRAYNKSNWKRLILLFQSAQAKVEEKIEVMSVLYFPLPAGGSVLYRTWNSKSYVRSYAKDGASSLGKVASNLGRFAKQRAQVENGVVFDFVEGALVEALRCGGWVLLDELNLASSAVLECLNGLLENDDGSLILTERGDTQPLNRHPAFRIFGCMNPATDVGKREIPPAIRGRMTEFYIEEPHHCDDLKMLIREYLSAVFSPPDHVVSDIAEFYRKAHQQASEFLCGGDHRKPHYSLRTLCRALDTTRHMTPHCGFVRALYEGMCVSFLTQLDTKSYATMQRHIAKHFAKKLKPGQLNAAYPRPGNNYELVEHFWLKLGPERVLSHEECKYILTASVRENLRRLSRVLIARQYPILLQGPTSSGKTSMVEYIAKRTGHKFVRINNHEHTDLQEYMGSYITDPTGRLVFQEGLLVQALRHGHWIVLDELNLAPTDVLEALNRLLDDNRELFLPETQEVLKAHPDFQLFATQNPPGIYGGRKVVAIVISLLTVSNGVVKLLSRAFRNRFVELHFDAIPEEELATILEKRCAIPPSYCAKIISVVTHLQKVRQGTRLFSGKHGFVTLRDLFRWCERECDSLQSLAINGSFVHSAKNEKLGSLTILRASYMLLAEKVRRAEEKSLVVELLQKHINVKLDAEVENFAAMFIYTYTPGL
ncbi:hypothetical protein Zmor_011973 [Zophobas morio]|uniref:Midasin n=1 Tax=Zophobas morio TaxID=2755281 RepID=A0AA38HIP6_9CUCU|nr:hypothetical protein Zmor_011973 [Zophobas morio]